MTLLANSPSAPLRQGKQASPLCPLLNGTKREKRTLRRLGSHLQAAIVRYPKEDEAQKVAKNAKMGTGDRSNISRRPDRLSGVSRVKVKSSTLNHGVCPQLGTKRLAKKLKKLKDLPDFGCLNRGLSLTFGVQWSVPNPGSPSNPPTGGRSGLSLTL